MRPERKNYTSDEEFFKALLAYESLWARNQREEIGYEADFKMRVTLIGPAYQVGRLPLTWGSMEEKYEVMGKTAYLARATSAKEIMLASDMRFINSEDFAEHFGIRRFIRADRDAYFKEYHRILKQYGNEMANLPRHLWRELVGIAIKTPQRTFTEMMPYTRDEDGRGIQWLESEPFGGYAMEMNVIEDWWKIPENDPVLACAREVSEVMLEVMVELDGMQK